MDLQFDPELNQVTIQGITATQALELKHELEHNGLTTPQDFFWLFHPSPHESFAFNDNHQPSSTVFQFCDAKMATFYQLKWAGRRPNANS